MARSGDEKTGMRGLDVVVLVVVTLFLVVVAFWAFSFVAGLVWAIVKVAVLALVIAGLLYVFVGRRRSD
ncbi:MAG TPA: hypothetical protein VKG43_03195 [Acidimicrobiales bacterium]|nr:hypothetical protein [Acidimicrobiales bacterium]